jgi:predicted Fe-Mo cluster-binding NifX family protein
MKIAITSIDGTMQGMLDERFGRAKKIIIYDTDTKTQTVTDNTVNLNAAQGAGIQSAQNILNEGAAAVISGHLGPNAFKVLQEAGIGIYSASGLTVSDALKAFEQGKLEKLSGADVNDHW